MKVYQNPQSEQQVFKADQQVLKEDPIFNLDSIAFIASFLFHIGLILGLYFTSFLANSNTFTLTLTSPLAEEIELLDEPEEVYFSQELNREIGANSILSSDMAYSEAPILEVLSQIPVPTDLPESQLSDIVFNDPLRVATALHFSEKVTVRGSAGAGVTGSSGAIDRITHEILLSLQDRKTLVIWLFDQSGSLERERKSIRDRFQRVYEELGALELSGNPAFVKYETKPLLSTIYAFGNDVIPMLKKPTDNVDELQTAIGEIKRDESGVERVFSAVYIAVDKNRSFRRRDDITNEPKRNIMVIVLTDEAGNDYDGLDETTKLCQRLEVPVYVIGAPAPFGRKETKVKWVDPDPKFDQTPQWPSVDQGPESLFPERINLSFSGVRQDQTPIDSGFGPFALTRLCYETGGIFFTVHPNRDTGRRLSRGETAAFSAHLSHFFEPDKMLRYRPDYISVKEYRKRLEENKTRASLVKAAQMSWLAQMQSPDMRFVRRSEAALTEALSKAQQKAAVLEPKIRALHNTLKLGEEDREKEFSPRWQAGYDLAMGRVLAIKVRTESYNAMLAQAKRGLAFKNPKNNTWILEPSNEISVGSQMEKVALNGKNYLQQVIKDHPNTPWAHLAQLELKSPMSWKWRETFTNLAPPRRRAGGGGGTPRPAVNEKRRMLQQPRPKRKPPKL